MKIISVRLVNFRSHVDSEFHFDDGINLLIGHNGAGKSSILEAIGFALFNADLRVKNQKSAVRYGEKTATVEVRFIGVDGNEYRVERKLGGTTHWRLYCGDESSFRYHGSKDVPAELRKLTGVKQNEKELFGDVICAVQNRFTNIFSQSDTDRETTFNRLFETAVYRDIFKAFNDDNSVIKSYETERSSVTGKSDILQETQIDRDTVTQELAVHNEKLNEQSGVVDRISREIDTVQKERDEVIATLNEHTLLTQKEKSLQSELTNLEGSLKTSEVRIRDAQVAVQVVADNLENHNRYIALKEKRDSLEKSISEYGTVREKQELLLQKEKSIADSITENRTRSAVIAKELETISKQIETDTEEHQKQQSHRDECTQLRDQTIPVGKELTEKHTKYVELFQDYEQQGVTVKELQYEMSSILPKERCSETINSEIECGEKSVQQLERENSDLLQYQSELSLIDSKIEELTKAQETLSEGICPILQEQCENTMVTGGADYFTARFEQLRTSRLSLEKSLNDLQEIPQKLHAEKVRVGQLQVELQQRKESDIRLKQIDESINLAIEKQNLITEKITLVEPDLTLDSDQYRNRMDEINAQVLSLRELYKQYDAQIITIDTAIQKCVGTIEEGRKREEELTSERRSRDSEIEQFQEELITVQTEKETVDKTITEYETIRSEIGTLQTEMSALEASYTAVLENREQSDKLESYQTDAEQHRTNITTTTTALTDVTKALSLLKRDTLEAEKERVTKHLTELTTSRDSAVKERNETTLLVRSCETRLADDLKNQERISELQKEIATIERKLELTQLFRSNIKDMGRFVASEIVEQIARQGSLYFHQITGKSDLIQWSVTESEKYTVYLHSMQNGVPVQREFSILSGGEQVAVALAIRTAMARELASGDFAIFDEPTVNLDVERKVALAESIKSMMGELTQTIIVTHDDLFREMAQNVIEL